VSSVLSFPDVNELSDDLRRIIDEFGRLHGQPCHGLSGLYAPALDVVQTATAIEVYVDLPGVSLGALRVLCVQENLIIVGENVPKEPRAPDGSAFHLLERGVGPFARVIRLNTAVDASQARAVLTAGELHVTLPRVEERRGREIAIRVQELKAR
jgi:HSP20 family protein